MKITTLFMFFFLSICACLANLKVAFIADLSLQQQNSAIFNGLRSAASELAFRHNEKIDVVFISTSDSQTQIQVLAKCYLNGFAGAILYASSADNALAEKISELAKVNFPTVLLGENLQSKDAVCVVSTDAELRLKMIESIIKQRSKKSTRLACYFKSENGEFLDLKNDALKIANLTNGVLSKDDFQRIFSPKLLEAKVFDFYSTYAEQNATEIMRRDSFGEVFFSPELLANMHPISPNSDREFALCVGGLPMLEFYLASGQITDCVYDDYFGWGVFAMRAFIEAKLTHSKSKEEQLVAPMRVSNKNYKVFVADWKKWLK